MTDSNSHIYNGVRVRRGWDREIEQAQLRTYTRINGQVAARVRYGEETKDLGSHREICEECAVLKGQIHVMGCDFEQCPICGGQFLYCPCSNEENM